MFKYKCHKIFFVIIYLLASAITPCNAKDFTVVIDPGHGGKDFGAIGKKNYEKNINLGVALKLGKLIEEYMYDVNIVYTRDTDRYLTLQKRADIANKAKGDLFISIHTNSISKKSPKYKTINGASTYTLGLHKTKENLEVAKRENAVIELESDYSETYRGFDPNSSESYIIFEISQNQHVDQSIQFASLVQKELTITANRKDNGVRQAGFWVLATTSMPSVLIELDFICNPKQEKFLSSDYGQKQLAKAIFNAFKDYKDSIDNKESIINKSKDDENNSNHNIESLRNAPGTKRAEDSTTVQQEKDIESEILYKKCKENDQKTTSDKDKDITIYKIQILTSNKKLRQNHYEFKKLSPIDYYIDNGLYKYTYGCTSSFQEANKILNTIQHKFKDAFIVKFINDKRIK